jgi:hypothetical protein
LFSKTNRRCITNAISTNLPSSGTKWLPIMTYIHTHPDIYFCIKINKINISDLKFFHYTSSVCF